jgi:hypothetical protein
MMINEGVKDIKFDYKMFRFSIVDQWMKVKIIGVGVLCSYAFNLSSVDVSCQVSMSELLLHRYLCQHIKSIETSLKNIYGRVVQYFRFVLTYVY